ncbi:MAG: tRNA (N6-isopentenyl adenosine(37)-C2)-methylthiotransferase MiaB [Acidobacteria bacterium]|nr:tRNA (N6-isopentenyl adenosine(37)-C2)-methylthiotransferase MiaB [Acidobacteriota bacterium]
MNKADSAKLAAGLDRLGHEAVAAPEDADLLVVNTCAVRDHAEQRAASKLGDAKRLKAKRRDLKIVLTGCMVGPLLDELRRRFPYVDAFAPPQAFADIVDAAGIDGLPEGCAPLQFWDDVLPAVEAPTAFVPVVYGCNKFCSYCIVPYRRGRERSRAMADVRGEVQHLVDGGVKEVTLLGQSVEAYGRDLAEGPDLAGLMRNLHEIDGLERIRFLTSYPTDVTQDIVDAVAALPKVCECFSLPLQSGDDDVLARMRRGYTVEQYEAVVEDVRRRVPGVAISTDVIVGFCGESDAQFQRTYDLLERLRFDKVHVAAYSPRPGTIAAKQFVDDVPRDAKRERLQAVEALQKRVAGEINARLVGSVQDVLVEEAAKGKWCGRTRGDKLVHFSGEYRPGDVAHVRIERASAWSLQGSALDAR